MLVKLVHLNKPLRVATKDKTLPKSSYPWLQKIIIELTRVFQQVELHLFKKKDI